MKAIFKYDVEPRGSFDVAMEEGAVVLYVDMQGGLPCMWALVDPERARTLRRFHVMQTGQKFSHDGELRYLGTFQIVEEDLVFHVFEEQ